MNGTTRKPPVLAHCVPTRRSSCLFGDAHVHPLFGALSRTRCPLQDGKTIADYQALIAKCVAAAPGDGAVYGIGWSDALFPPNGIPRKEIGRAHVCTPVTNAHIVCRLLLDKNKPADDQTSNK